VFGRGVPAAAGRCGDGRIDCRSVDDERGLPSLVVLRVGAIQLSGDLWEIWASGRFGASPATERGKGSVAGLFRLAAGLVQLSFLFCRVHGGVGRVQCRFRVVPGKGEVSSDTAAHGHYATVDPMRLTQRAIDRGGELGQARLAGSGNDHGEFVAAEPADGVARPCQLAQPMRHGLQHLVAGCVAERVVDDFESVQINEEHAGADTFPTVGAGQRFPEPGMKQRPIGEA